MPRRFSRQPRKIAASYGPQLEPRKERLKELVAQAIDDGYMELGDANAMIQDLIDNYLTDVQASAVAEDYFPGIWDGQGYY